MLFNANTSCIGAFCYTCCDVRTYDEIKWKIQIFWTNILVSNPYITLHYIKVSNWNYRTSRSVYTYVKGYGSLVKAPFISYVHHSCYPRNSLHTLQTPPFFQSPQLDDSICNILMVILYSRKLSRVKTFANFTLLPPSAKVLSANFGVGVDREQYTIGNPPEFYSQNALLNYFKVSSYTVVNVYLDGKPSFL